MIISNHNQTINIQVQAATEHALTQHHNDILIGKQSINGEANLRLNVVDFPGSELYVDNLGVLRSLRRALAEFRGNNSSASKSTNGRNVFNRDGVLKFIRSHSNAVFRPDDQIKMLDAVNRNKHSRF